MRGVPLSVTDLSYQVGRGVPGVHPDTHSVSQCGPLVEREGEDHVWLLERMVLFLPSHVGQKFSW